VATRLARLKASLGENLSEQRGASSDEDDDDDDDYDDEEEEEAGGGGWSAPRGQKGPVIQSLDGSCRFSI